MKIIREKIQYFPSTLEEMERTGKILILEAFETTLEAGATYAFATLRLFTQGKSECLRCSIVFSQSQLIAELETVWPEINPTEMFSARQLLPELFSILPAVPIIYEATGDQEGDAVVFTGSVAVEVARLLGEFQHHKETILALVETRQEELYGCARGVIIESVRESPKLLLPFGHIGFVVCSTREQVRVLLDRSNLSELYFQNKEVIDLLPESLRPEEQRFWELYGPPAQLLMFVLFYQDLLDPTRKRE